MAMLEGSISIWASMNSWFTPTVLFGFLNLMIVTIFITSSHATHKHNEDQKQQQPHQLARSPSMLQRMKSINFYNYKSQEPTTNYATTTDFNTYFSTQHQQEPQQQQQQQTHFTPPQQQQQQQPYFSRSPSMLQRLKSINLYSYLSQESTSPSTTTTTTSTNHKIQETKTTHDSFQQTHEQEPEEEQEEEDELEHEQEQTLDEIYSQLQGIHVSRSNSDAKPASGEIPTKQARKMKKSASAKSVFKHFEEENIAESLETRRPATVREGTGKVTEDDHEVDAKADDFINKFKHQLKLQRMDSNIRYKEMIARGSGK